MTYDPHLNDLEPDHESSPTGRLLEDLVLYGHRTTDDETDPRPAPDANDITAALTDIFDALVATMADTVLEPDLGPLLWSTVNLFHQAAARVQTRLDLNEDAQKRSQREQDGSEVRSTTLERLLAEGRNLLDRRDGLEAFREQAAELHQMHLGAPWTPRAGSRVNHRTLTAAMIDSRDFLAAKRHAETAPLLPPGPKVAVTGGSGYNDHGRIWALLDRVLARHPDMVLLHGGTPTGAERIAACWAEARQVPHIAFRPDWSRHGKAAPFKRNDRMLELMPIGVLAFPGSGINANLADKAKALGLPVRRFDGG
ncbi:DUF2493 domain-containing protein [Phenylobacterium sp.]|uniref:DUF2493 domain-containing protein n=1 Tax=Phenylobacterium sp. TaxID=1871053 RepID=UPI0035B39CCE